MTSLLNPLLIRTNILSDMSIPVPPLAPFFRTDINFSFILQNIVIPFVLLLILAFFLKARYDKKNKHAFTPEITKSNSDSDSEHNVFY
jgi:hypothetical protein